MLHLFENDIVDNARRQKGHILIRRQRCMGCNRTLAIEITDKLGKRGEYWVMKDILHVRGRGSDFLYGKEVWFGNYIKCLNCGREGRLPMDKPLAAEEMAKTKEARNAKNRTVPQT